MTAPFHSALLTSNQKPEFLGLLGSYFLPTEDLDQDHLLLFRVTRGQDTIGCFGLELLNSNGLLRSLAIYPEYHEQGAGKAVSKIALTEARDRGIKELYLLTTDKQGFFAKLGFTPIAKDQLPHDVQNTREFRELCPDSAVSMKITLT